MKRTILTRCLMVVLALAVFVSCNKEKNTITEYIGTVIEGTTMAPLPDVKVSVANGSRVLVSTVTDEEGAFSMYVNFDKVNERDSLIIDGSPNLPYQKKFELKGMGKEQYDYRDLVLYNQTDYELKTFQYAGTTYYVHPEVGVMDWQSAMVYCENLSFAGYSDWFLPDKDELNVMFVYRDLIGNFITTGNSYSPESSYWSSTPVYSDLAWYQNFSSGRQDGGRYHLNLRVRPVRKDKK